MEFFVSLCGQTSDYIESKPPALWPSSPQWEVDEAFRFNLVSYVRERSTSAVDISKLDEYTYRAVKRRASRERSTGLFLLKNSCPDTDLRPLKDWAQVLLEPLSFKTGEDSAWFLALQVRDLPAKVTAVQALSIWGTMATVGHTFVGAPPSFLNPLFKGHYGRLLTYYSHQDVPEHHPPLPYWVEQQRNNSFFHPSETILFSTWRPCFWCQNYCKSVCSLCGTACCSRQCLEAGWQSHFTNACHFEMIFKASALGYLLSKLEFASLLDHESFRACFYQRNDDPVLLHFNKRPWELLDVDFTITAKAAIESVNVTLQVQAEAVAKPWDLFSAQFLEQKFAELHLKQLKSVYKKKASRAASVPETDGSEHSASVSASTPTSACTSACTSVSACTSASLSSCAAESFKFAVGDRVVLSGLKGNQGLNGKLGRTRKWVKSTGRWAVVLDGESEAVSVKTVNLTSVGDSFDATTAFKRVTFPRSMPQDDALLKNVSETNFWKSKDQIGAMLLKRAEA